jgi:hypothetical protein
MGGDAPAPQTQESMASVLAAYANTLPDILRVARQEVGPTEQAFLDSLKSTAPQQADLNAGLYEQYAPRFAESNAATEADLLKRYGADTVRTAYGLQQEVDAPYYAAREQAGNKLGQLLSGLDPNRLTEGESSEVERLLNRSRVGSGDLRNPDSTGVVSAAQTFGSALQSKRNAVSQAIDNATNFLSQSRTGIDTFGQATGRLGTQAFGQGFYNNQPGAGAAFGMANSALGTAAGLRQQENDINANRRDSLDRVTGVLSSLPSIS